MTPVSAVGELCMAHPHVVIEPSDAGYLRVSLARPERRKALDPGMVSALTGAMRERDDAVVVLASSDPQAFCAGADPAIPG
jgi:enoyl-CoA hydratase/carnithine racemase